MARISGLDGLRAIAIALVLLSHLKETFPEGSSFLHWRIWHVGNLGVDCFFVVSGYLITRLMLAENQRTGGVSLKRFYIRRIFRIFPAFYTYYFTVVILSICGVFVLWDKTLLNSAFFITNYKHYWTHNDGPNYWIVGHFWTLSLEEQFYLLWPAIFCFLGRRRALVSAVTMIAVIQGMRGLSYYFDVGSRGQIDMMLHTSLDTIMIGCVLALAESSPRFQSGVSFLASNWMALIAALYFVVPPVFHLTGTLGHLYTASVGRLFSFFWIAVIVIWTTRSEKTPVGRIMNSRPIAFVGVLSYSLYLWQQLFLGPVNTYWSGRFPQNILCSFGAALLSYYLIETPFLRLRERLFKSRSKGAVVVPSTAAKASGYEPAVEQR